MSRWIDNFENHAFQSVWQNIKNNMDELSAVDETVITDVKEIARLKKVVSFLDELMNAADPELVPLSTWDQFNSQASACFTQITNYEQNKNIGHIQNANTHLDNLLTYLRPYVLTGKGSAQATGKAFKTYSDTVDKHINILADKAKNAVNQAEENRDQTNSVLDEINQSKERIRKLEVELLDGTDNEESLRDQMHELIEEATSWHSKIESFHQKLTSGSEEESAIILQIEEAKEKAIKNSASTKDALKSSKELIEGLEEFYNKIFGEEDDAGVLEGGLKQELEVRTTEIEEFKKEQEETYKTLLEEIEGLLPGATSAGLATAYRELKESFDNSIKNNSKLFYGALFGIFVTALMLITKQVGFWFIEFIDVSNGVPLFTNLLYKLPILLPLLWLAMFASKRRSEDRRLQQEYAHKEALAKSYQSFKQQIESLKTEDNALMKQLLEKAITAIAFNASTTLDGKHGDKMPVMEVLDKLAEKGMLEINPLKKNKLVE